MLLKIEARYDEGYGVEMSFSENDPTDLHIEVSHKTFECCESMGSGEQWITKHDAAKIVEFLNKYIGECEK